ncbi:MAG: methyltransferase domain-containing protein [Ilumatobacteraceae bacterium]
MTANILILCTGNATRSVIAGAVLTAHLPDVEVVTAGTMSIDGLPMSWRTRAGFESVGVKPPPHRSRQVVAEDLDRATVVIGLAPEHVNWVRREHPAAADRTVTLKRLVRELAADGRPLTERVAELHLADAELGPWEEVVDPGGGEVEAFIACAQEVVELVDDVADRLRPGALPADSWTDSRADRWVSAADAIDGQLTPVSDTLFAAADIRPGEAVLDVGCGTGPTTRRAAALAGPGGAVVGLDIATAMLDAARARAVPDRSAPIEWVEADAVTWEPTERRFDVVISRFGVMFFSDPATAFANLHRATAPGGRLCVAVWGHREQSPIFEVPLDVALGVLARSGQHPDAPPPDAGPFSLGDPAAVVALLRRAGWVDVEWRAERLALPVAGGAGPAEAARLLMQLGPARVVTAELAPERPAALEAAMAVVLADHVDADGHVILQSTIGIVTARAAALTPPA